MTEEEIEFQMMLRTDLFLQEIQFYNYLIMGENTLGIPLTEQTKNNLEVARNQFILDMKNFKPDFEMEDIQTVKGRFLIGYDSIATSNGNQIIPELKKPLDIYTLNVAGVGINNLPEPPYDIETGELFYSMNIGEKFRLTYKLK